MQNCPLDHPLEAEGRLGVDFIVTSHGGGVLVDEFAQVLAQKIDLGAAGTQGIGCRRVVEQGEQQMLHGNEFVALLSGLDKGHVEANLQFLGNHQFSSMMQASGCWC